MYFEISFYDLSDEKKEELIESLVKEMLIDAKTEGDRYLTFDWHDPKPKTWQEAYCRSYAIKSEWWEDYENKEAYLKNPYNKEEDIEVPKDQDWIDWLEDEFRELAESKLGMYFKRAEFNLEAWS